MKNIHLIPTEKPSRLSILNNGKLNFGAEFISSSNSKAQNIYITNDEDINENDYIITQDGRLIQVSYLLSKELEGAAKVVLTTDQDLIKDGVQPIDDEFLEWFVKNPSCESVEVLIKNKTFDKDGFISSVMCDTKKVEKIYSIIPQEESKQETLEEAADIDSKNHYKDQSDYWAIGFDSFKRGAKWQAKKMYSEKEVKHIISEALQSALVTVDLEQWFKQFKKQL
jgi:hypothetical protein